MRRERCLLAASVLLVACSARVLAPAQPVGPSTHRDPPAHAPAPTEAPSTGGLVGARVTGGEDQARSLLVVAVGAIRRGDVETLRRTLAPEVFHGGSLLAGRTRRGVSGLRLAEQLVAQARARGLEVDADFESLVDASSITVEPVSRTLPDVPPGLSAGDLVVRFTVPPHARPALGGLVGGDGRGVLVVRPGEDPRIVAR